MDAEEPASRRSRRRAARAATPSRTSPTSPTSRRSPRSREPEPEPEPEPEEPAILPEFDEEELIYGGTGREGAILAGPGIVWSSGLSVPDVLGAAAALGADPGQPRGAWG